MIVNLTVKEQETNTSKKWLYLVQTDCGHGLRFPIVASYKGDPDDNCIVTELESMHLKNLKALYRLLRSTYLVNQKLYCKKCATRKKMRLV